jgi:hypothetical protein
MCNTLFLLMLASLFPIYYMQAGAEPHLMLTCTSLSFLNRPVAESFRPATMKLHPAMRSLQAVVHISG